MKDAWYSYVKYPGINSFYGRSAKAYLKGKFLH